MIPSVPDVGQMPQIVLSASDNSVCDHNVARAFAFSPGSPSPVKQED
jgi:hypothetical protein